jgi:hypothetical protein
VKVATAVGCQMERRQQERASPVRPSHIFTLLSKDALAIMDPSGLKATWFTGCMWPVMRATGFLLLHGNHRHSV